MQAFLVDADHHPGVLTLHTEADALKAPMLLGSVVFPGPVVEGGGQRHRRREEKGKVGAPRGSGMRTGVPQDGQLWR